MKKSTLVAVVALIALMSIVFTACASTTTANVTSETTTTASAPTVETLVYTKESEEFIPAVATNVSYTEKEYVQYTFPHLEDDSAAVFDYYRYEVSRRVRFEENFITEAEEAWYRENGYVIGNRSDGLILEDDTLYHDYYSYSYPIIVTIGSKDRLVYTTENGGVLITPSLSHTNWLGNLHLTYSELEALGEDAEVMESYVMYELVYVPSLEKIQEYRFGHLVETATAKGVYTGRSFWVGYIFRDGSDVFAVRWDSEQEEYVSECIAHHVQYVIDADYYLSSDPWSQPLFLMEDGTLKAYLDWNNPDDPDSLENLVDPYYEGGYDR